MTRRLIPAAPTSRRGRLARATLLAPVVALTLAGCQWTSTVQTDQAYEPGNGRSVTVGQVTLNNLLVVAEKKGGEGTVVGTGTNEGQKDAKVTLAVADQAPVDLTVPARDTARFSDLSEGKPTTVDTVPVDPGALVPATITVDGTQETLQLPVVPPYAPYGTATPTQAEPAPAEGGH